MNYYKVLVLNNTYEPLHFCNGKRAIVMLLKGRAEQIEQDGITVHSPTISIKLPSVIRLMHFVKIKRKRHISFSKKNVFKRDNYTCQYCGKKEPSMTIDHIIPKSRGGTTNWENVVAACQGCNVSKGDKIPNEIGFRLIKKPFKPDYLFFPYSRRISLLHIEVWNKYLPNHLKYKYAEL